MHQFAKSVSQMMWDLISDTVAVQSVTNNNSFADGIRIKLGEHPAEKDADKTKAKDDIGDENTWRLKMAGARAALEQDQVLYDAVQSRIYSLVSDFASRDDPAQRAEIERQRVRALDELDRLKKQIQKDTDNISDIGEDARKKGVPAGWIRLSTQAD